MHWHRTGFHATLVAGRLGATMDVADAQELLWEQIYGLKPTGVSGFEGFLAAALSELSEQPFHVVKSGPQGGSDVRSGPCNLVKASLEAKRYSRSTSLPQDALLSKVTEASTLRTPPDLWLLASTRQVDSSLREALVRHGELLGIDVLVLGWPEHSNALCDLAAISAAAPQACANHLKRSSKTHQALELIRKSGEFESKVSMWRDRLVAPAVGYASCREQCQRWLHDGQSSLRKAKSRLGGHHNLRDTESTVIRRTGVSQQLNAWFADKRSPIAALVGDEGTGKSWAALDWCDELIDPLEPASPLIVYLPATSVRGTDARADIAQALSKQARAGSAEFWLRRLSLWERSGKESTRILVIVDGLNQNFLFSDWADWAQPLLEDNLGEMYKLVLSCWPNRWRDDLYCLSNLEPKPIEILVEGFSDAELDELLTAMTVNRDVLTEPVLELMRVPRLAAIALKHHEALADSGDVTAERVIYEDWKDRISRQGTRVGMDDARMRAFIANLGRDLRNDVERAVTRRNIMATLSADSGSTGRNLEVAVLQLTSGGWFTVGDDPDRFKLNTDRVHYVLGAALLSELKQGSRTDFAGIIAEFLDPLKAHSLGSKILRAATTIALVEEGTDSQLRHELMCRWLNEQNFSSADFEDLWRLAGLDPDLVLGVAERDWLSARTSGMKDEVLIKTLANAAQYPRFHEALLPKLVGWLGTAWSEPVIDAVAPGQNGNASSSGDARSRHKLWLRSPESKEFAPVRFQVEGSWNYLARCAVAVCSYSARAPYVAAIEAWALSRALMESPHELDDVAWILRINSEDPSEADDALAMVIRRLEQCGHTTARKAASTLRKALSDVARENVVGLMDDKGEGPAAPSARDGVKDKEGRSAFDSVVDYLAPRGWKQIDAHSGAELIDTLIAQGLPPGGREIDLLVNKLREFLTIISPKSRSLLAVAFDQEQRAAAREGDAQRGNKLGFSALLLRLYDATPAEQAGLILSSRHASMGDEWQNICRLPGSRDLAQLDISSAPREGLLLWLDYVGQRLAKAAIPGLEFLPMLATHEDREIRRRALFLASDGRHLDALMRFADSAYVSPVSGDSTVDRLDELARNIALLELESIRPKLDPSAELADESVALRVKWGAPSDAALDAFADYLEGELKAITTATSWSMPRYWYIHYLDCVKLVVERGQDPVEEWLSSWAKNAGRGADKALMNNFPVMDTMRALKDKAPEVVLSAFRAIQKGVKFSIFSRDAYHEFPFELARSHSSDAACDECLSLAVTDDDLLGISYYCHKHDRVDWLLERIRTLQAKPRPVDLAKAITLLGLCDQSAEADEQWNIIALNPPLDSWLRTVLKASREDYQRNVRARAALHEFWQTDIDERAARHLWKRVEENCDRRVGTWYRSVEPTNDVPYRRRLARSLGNRGLNDAIKKDRDRRKKTLFHTPIPVITMAPWR